MTNKPGLLIIIQVASNHDEIWAGLTGDNQHFDDPHALGLGEDWAKDYLEHALQDDFDESKVVQETAVELVEQVNDPKFAYSKVGLSIVLFFRKIHSDL